MEESSRSSGGTELLPPPTATTKWTVRSAVSMARRLMDDPRLNRAPTGSRWALTLELRYWGDNPPETPEHPKDQRQFEGLCRFLDQLLEQIPMER